MTKLMTTHATPFNAPQLITSVLPINTFQLLNKHQTYSAFCQVVSALPIKMAPNVYESLYKHFMVYKCHGLTSFAIVATDKKRKRLVSRKIDIVLQTSVILLVTSWLIFCWVWGKDAFEEDLLSKLFYDTIRTFTAIGMYVLFATGLVRKQQLPIIFHEINNFDERLAAALQVQLFYTKRPKRYIFVRALLWTIQIISDVINTQKEKHGLTSATEFLTYYIFFEMMTISSSMYCSLIWECRKRIKFANDYMEKIFFGNSFVACIETKLTPVANVCYSLEDIKTELSALIDTVEDINRYFQVQLFVKAANMFQSVLWASYYFIVNSGEKFDFLLSLQSEFYITNWSFICLVDFCIDIHTYQSLLAEVSKHLLSFCSI